ncbi:MAG: threonine synthase [Oscillospiraceae bacterium]|nr:threonine synthase [Oscillospiraceae bacterium]
MNYTSTRNSSISITAADAIVKGISDEGGLFVPAKMSELPKLTIDEITTMADKPYPERAYDVLRRFLDFGDDELRDCVNNAYNFNFKTIGTTRLVNLVDSIYMLELWHGPTAAFKDMALQILPGLMSISMRKASKTRKTLILVATSGDTGKAALEGFKDVGGIEIAVFYPEDGVSDTQKMQMITQEGENVHVFAVKGNFDDCQNAVKAVFTDSQVGDKAAAAGVAFSSANSINWGRLCPQIAYYISAYADLVQKKAIKPGDKINICVPTGNFGNILAAYYAMEIGLPINKLICASNTNKILTDFINTGVYDRNREFHTTASPSMDILISSNLERLLYHISGESDSLVSEWFIALKQTGKFEVGKELQKKMNSLFYGGWCSESETAETIKSVFNESGYLMDTHTAVGYKVLLDYLKTDNSGIKTLMVSTANPYKFGESVYEALYGEYNATEDAPVFYEDVADEFENDVPEGMTNEVNAEPTGVMKTLQDRTGIPAPKSLTSLNGKPIRFTETLSKEQIKDAVLKIIN